MKLRFLFFGNPVVGIDFKHGRQKKWQCGVSKLDLLQLNVFSRCSLAMVDIDYNCQAQLR